MSERKVTDHELLSRYQGGDREALRAFYRRHELGLYQLLTGLCGDSERACELMQELILRLCRGVDRYLAATDIVNYLYQSARNLALEKGRRESSQRNAMRKSATARLKAAPAAEGDSIATEENARRLAEAVEALPEQERRILVLHLYEGLTFKTVSELTEIPERSVYRSYQRALERLKDRLINWD